MHKWSFGHFSSLSYPQGEQGTSAIPRGPESVNQH
jgi:hypothetical protein